MGKTKDIVQGEARVAHALANQRSLLAIATGVGKSKIAIDEIADLVAQYPNANIVLAVPTQKLRDTNWLEEFEKWQHKDAYSNNVTMVCYASINKIKSTVIDYLVLDEAHNITDANSDVFRHNTILRVLCLTATPPDPKGNDTDQHKVEIFKRLQIPTSFIYTLDEAVNDGLVAPYEIRVVECTLDNTNKYVEAGSKVKRFYQTERQAYDYKTKIIKTLQFGGNEAVKWKLLDRMRFVQNLKSKTEIARRVIARWYKPEDRYIVFTGSIEQCNLLCGPNVYHSKVKDLALEAFKKGEINLIGVVEALNEGHNIPFVDGAYIVQISSKHKDLVQRIGRTIRARPGHKAILWIFVVLDTVDEEWFKKAIEPFDKSRITYIHYKNVI